MKKNTLKMTIFRIVFFCMVSPILMAQQVVTGRITDFSDGTPIPGASIYIANTTVGTTSGESGNYSLTVPGRGSFEIVVSHVGYQSVFHKINAPQGEHQYDVALETSEIEEVIIKAAKTYNNKDVNLFWFKILGENPSRRGMEVLHPEKVYFYKKDNVLKAMCREPIEIINHHTGYRIRYVLQSFEHNYRTGETEFAGMPSFEELISANSRQKESWEKKRQDIYAISLNRFLRALYQRQLHEEGFVLSDQNTQRNNGRIIPFSLENILQVGQDAARLNIRDPLYLLCYSQSVTSSMIQDGNWGDIFKDDFPGNTSSISMGIGGAMSSSSPPIVNYSNSKKGGPVVVELKPSRITVYSDGTYYGTLTIGEVNKYVGGLSSRVPVEYPETEHNNSHGLPVLPSYSPIGKAEENITAQLNAFPQEKIHLHTDRNFYIPGEKIWFKAYIVDAQTHLHQTESWYAYVELISAVDTLVNRVMITKTDGMFYGHLPISAIVPEGNYTLRAYTRYMENLGDDYFFKKNIRIGNHYCPVNL